MQFTLPKSFYARPTVQVAQELLGKKIVRVLGNGLVLSGIITETEAYQSDDPACHAYAGLTPRTAPLFGPVGHTYVYFIYGNHFCLNIVARESIPAGGVLIRSLEPVEGIEYMKHARNTAVLTNLTTGPGKLTQALRITQKEQGINVMQPGSLYITQGETEPYDMVAVSRVGITKAVEKKWRFYLKNNRYISKK